jgi:hypothetical protein
VKINKKFVGLMLVITVFAMALMLIPGVARADWSVTLTWTRSAGPNLASESVLLDDVSKCVIAPAAPTLCQFNVPNLSGQVVKVRSFNDQGAYADTTPVTINPAPAPPGNLLINVTYIQP